MTASEKLIEQRDALVADVEAALAADEVSAEALDAVSAKQDEIAALDERIATAQAVEARTAELAESRKASGVKPYSATTITREAMTYDKDGRNSFVRDMINATVRNEPMAWERLNRHRQEVAVETRDINRVDGSGGDFVQHKGRVAA